MKKKKSLKKKICKIGNIKKLDFIIGFANISNLKNNKIIYDLLKNFKCKVINFFHHTSIIDKSVRFGSGVKVFPSAIINRGCKIKNNVLINTGAIIEHDCILDDHVQISPGVILGGNVKIGKLTFVGIGTKIIQSIKIGKNCIIGAGSVVIKNIPNNSIYAGVPAKRIGAR